MKQETKIDTPKNLETRITAALTSTDITSTDLEILLQETENTLSDTVVKIERERAFDLTKSPDAVAAHRAMTEAEFIRARLRLVLPELQQKLQEAEAREFAAQWEADYLHGDAVCNKAAENFACLPALFAKIIDIYREREAVNAMRSKINSAAPPGEHRRLKDPELLARGLDNFSRANPPMSEGTQLPDWSHSEKMFWPIRQSFFPYAPAPQDIYHTSEWGRAADRQRCLNDERIDRELAEIERQRKEFYAGR